MRKIALAAAAAAILALGPAQAQEQVVKIYNWSDYIDPAVLDAFTAETGIKVVYDVYDSNEVLETKLLAGSTGYDLVVPTGNFLARQIQAGIFAPLDRAKLPNWGNLDADLMTRAAKYDPDNQHAFIYLWGTTGLGYNVDKVKERLPDAPVDSWALLFDPANAEKLADCGIMMLDSPTDVIPHARRYIGEDPDSKDPAVIEKGMAVLEKIRPYVRKFHSSENLNALANGDICLSLMWSGDAGIAKTRAEEANSGVNIQYSIPKEGAQLWFDMMAMPSERRQCLHLPQLSPRARGDGQDLELRHLSQRGDRVLAADRRGSEIRPEPVPDGRGQAEPVHGEPIRSAHAADRIPALDQARHRQLSQGNGGGNEHADPRR